MDAWTGRDVGRRRLCRASPSDRSVTLFDVKFVSPRKLGQSTSCHHGTTPGRTARDGRARDEKKTWHAFESNICEGGRACTRSERENERRSERASGSVFGRTVRRDGRTEGSPVPPQLGAQHVFRRRRQLHHAVVSLDGRERVRRGPSRPAPDPLTEPPHVQPPGVIAEQQRRRRRPRPRLRRPPRARLRPLFLSLRGCFRRHGPRSSACHRQRGALRHAHHPHGMPFTKISPPGTPGAARRSPPRARWHPPRVHFHPRRPPTVAPRPSPTRARRACAVFSSP